MLTLTLDKESEKALRAFDKNTRKEKVYPAILRVMRIEGERLIAAKIRTNLVSGQLVNVRSGIMRTSIGADSELYQGLPAARVGGLRGPAVKYLGIQEFGTKGKNPASPYPDIRPKNGKALAMPEPGGRAVTPTGNHRYSGPRAYPGTLKFVLWRKGNAIGGLYDIRDLAPKRGQGFGPVDLSKIKPVYRLLRKVAIRPKGFIRKGVELGLPALAAAIGEAVRKQALKEAS